ncbi:CRISPR-associated endonuclease Cas2 [Heliophilum fasciatum]|uniref:CRISPR-associated endoribonuclease Cas2 n=1 Tax=Heliophilum fasciatum TaxID=35700 RepID=A0A4V2SVZ3_9FIRM|nr:CRISPR-associated endonuclease Cas2 [Heliophilum fasciatum]MCW2279335.1 CRISPR-associated protein Cas2 [Heliophilum fasciatum]TCP60316.1 CRISPR-associated Cas2 family protein [Heliophilum fasciatum]
MRYVIAYDIANDRRRQKVAAFLQEYGRRVEKSLFECNVNKADLQMIVARLQELLEKFDDCCHIYRVCGDCLHERLVIGEDTEKEWSKVLVL